METMKIGGEKVVRTEKEVILQKPDQEEEAKREEEQVRPANAPSLRRPGEDAEDAPKPANGIAPAPPPMSAPSPREVRDRGIMWAGNNLVGVDPRSHFAAFSSGTSTNEKANETFAYSFPSTST